MVEAAQTKDRKAENPVYRPNTLFKTEDLASPRFKIMREKYGLDKAVAGETDEFKRILKLRDWLHRHVKLNKTTPAVEGDALAMLVKSAEGGRYSCGHYMAMQGAILNAMGHVTRNIFAAAGEKEKRLSGAHGINEVWVNSLRKWVMLDAELNSHFEKNGVPLSALEIRDEVVRDGGKDVYRHRGTDRRRLPRQRDDTWGETPRTYAWVAWYPEGNVHSIWPKRRSGYEYILDDEHWRAKTWYRGGKKHWAYDAGYFKPVKDRNAIYWTPNVLKVDVKVSGGKVDVRIESHTPNLREYQMMAPGGEWEKVAERFTLKIGTQTERRTLRAVNTVGIAGPEYQLVLARP